MIEYISLINYRGVRNQTKFDLKPITILIGPNNSGKSSLIKALMLLKNSLKFIEILRLQDGDHNLGSFTNILSKNSTQDYITFELPFRLCGFSNLRLVYSGANNKINNGFLKELEITRGETSVVQINEIKYSGNSINIKAFDLKINYNLFLDYFKHCRSEEEKERNRLIEHIVQMGKETLSSHVMPSKNDEFEVDKPIIKFENTSTEAFESTELETEFLNDVLSTQYMTGVSLIDYDEYHSLLYLLNNSIVNTDRERTRQGFILDKFLLKHNLRSVSITKNGKLFFEKVSRSIRDAFQHIVGEFSQLQYASSKTILQERLYINKNDFLHSRISSFLQDSTNKRQDVLDEWMKKFQLIDSNEYVNFNRVADTGYEVQIVNSDNGQIRNLADLGLGLTQVLSFLIELTSIGFHQHIIEEPESNLHPSLQSQLADLFTSLCRRKRFIIETHSEYMIRKFQYLIAKGELNKNDIIIHYFWKDKKSGEHKTKVIQLNDDGGLTDTFENGFFDESLRLELDLLKVNNLN